jgi:hypothetical protein
VGYTAQTVPLLFEQEAAKRSKNGVELFRACGRDEGCAPSTCANFWKSLIKTFVIEPRKVLKKFDQNFCESIGLF